MVEFSHEHEMKKHARRFFEIRHKNMLITKKNIRRYLLLKQLLLPPQSLDRQKGIDTVFNAIHSIQFDPQNPCGTNVDLVLQARVKGIHPQDYYLWLYKQRKGIECFDKELCIVPIRDYFLCKKLFSNSSRKKMDNFIQENSATVDNLILRITDKTPAPKTIPTSLPITSQVKLCGMLPK